MKSHTYDKPDPANASQIKVEIIVPARNEEDCIARCLQSLVNQQGIAFHITVVNDGSTDRTRDTAESFAGVKVIDAAQPQAGVSGKNNAIVQGVRGVTAEWLLFTDADTEHLPGSLAAAVREAEGRGVDLLSYSPEQEVPTWSERALMPVVFAELVRVYPPQRVNDPRDPTVAANGQYILVRRSVYEELGGHHAVANKLLEDVALATIFKASDHRIYFRFGQGLVRTRMYRSFTAMWEGWTKNLTLLFPSPGALALRRALEFVMIVGSLAAGIILVSSNLAIGLALIAMSSLVYVSFLSRIRRAHFPTVANLAALFGLPLFAMLLIRSRAHFRHGVVTWKGRTYAHFVTQPASNSSIARRPDNR